MSKKSRISAWTGLAAIAVLAAAALGFGVTTAVADDFNGPVAVNGHNLHLECTGSGSPTVVYEAGLGGGTIWDDVTAQLAGAGVRACRYDRYGIGESDAPTSALTLTIEQVAVEKHEMLAAAGVSGPLILVSHSMGGLIDRYYAKAWAGQVVGVVLIDTAPDDWNLFTHTNQFAETPLITFDVGPVSKSLRAFDKLGKRAVVVIQAEFANIAMNNKYWSSRQRALAKISSNSIYFVARGTDHNVPGEAPKLVARAIQLVASSARSHKQLPTCKAAKLARLGARC